MVRTSSSWQVLDFGVQATLDAGTSDVQATLGSSTEEVQLVDEFTHNGRRVVLIDTPGFNDTTKNGTDVLKDDCRLLYHNVSADAVTIPAWG